MRKAVQLTIILPFSLYALGGILLIPSRAEADEELSLLITEFMATKGSDLVSRVEGKDTHPDWIEIFNATEETINIEGWYLTDNRNNLTKWECPSIAIGSGAYIVICASEKEHKHNPSNYPYYDSTYGYYHTNFALDIAGEYLAFVKPDGVTIADEFSPQYPPQRAYVSYGLCAVTEEYGYFVTPTPGQANPSSCITEIVADTNFSVERGFYTFPFSVAITTDTTGASIYYTTDGSDPITDGILYQDPISISTTTCLRAQAFKVGMLPTHVDTHTYIFLADVIQQDGSGFPDTWGRQGADYAMDSVVVSNYSDTILDDLQTLPVVSLVMDVDDWFSSNRGIYAHPEWEDPPYTDEDAERAVSVEFFAPVAPEDPFQINAVLRLQGGTSTQPWKMDKLSMRLKFQEPYGPTKLNYAVFADEDAAVSFDTLLLDARMNNSWAYAGNVSPSAQRERAQYTRDQFASDIQNAMGGYGPHGQHVHLYLNGLYWGLYDLHERPDESFAAFYFGGSNKDYDVLKHNENTVVNGTDDNYKAMFDIAQAGLSSSVQYALLSQYLDVPDFIDYMLMNFYIGNQDWAHHNWYATRDVYDPAGRWRYYSWDAEKGLQDEDYNAVTDDDGYGSPTYLHQKLSDNSEYRMLFADRIHRHLFNDGPLATANATALYQYRLEMVDRAVVGESARWGDNVIDKSGIRFKRDPHWTDQRDELLADFFPTRTQTFLQQLKDEDLYPSLAAPEFFINGTPQHGGSVSPGDALSMSVSSGIIYYTTDGTDPRQEGGSVNPTSQTYSSAISVTKNVYIKARTRNGSDWSALLEAVFGVDTFVDDLRITEIMYHPVEAEVEFIELKNIGDAALHLQWLQFTQGIDFMFGDTPLAAGAYVVVVRDSTRFLAAYPDFNGVIAGEYSGALSDAGERITLQDALGQAIHDFSYNDNWYGITDGNGFSLTYPDPESSELPYWDFAASWRPSAYVGGSPGQIDEALPTNAIVINELLAHSDTGVDWIELYNCTEQAVNIGGWFLSDQGTDDPNLKKFEIPADTWIPTGDFLVFYEDLDFNEPGNPGCHKPFALSENGETAFLSSGKDGALGGYRQEEAFGASERDVSFGCYYKASTGTHNFVAMSENTPGQTNADPKVGPVVIDRIMYNPAFGHSEEEYVRLKNISNDSVMLQEYDNKLDTDVPWKFTDGIDYTFPLGVTLPAGEFIVVAKDIDSFEDRYGTMPLDTQVFGPYEGQLNNAGEKVEISMPGDQDPDTNDRYYIRIDRVNYDNVSPWPTAPNGGGEALGRIEDTDYGNDAANWQGVAPDFSEVRYRLDIVTTGNGTVQIDPAGDIFPEDTEVQLTAVPDDGWWLISWNDTDDDSSIHLSNTVTMNTNRQVNVLFHQNAITTATKCTIKAGKERGQDSISISGHILASPGDFADAENVHVCIYHSLSQLTYAETISMAEFSENNGDYKYKNSTGITSIQLNTNKQSFSLAAKNINLGGLKNPVTLEIQIGDYLSYIDIDETILNGPKKTIPMVLMRSYGNMLYVDPKKTKVKSGTKVNSDTLTVKGAIAVENYPLDVTNEEVVITWGEQTFTIPAGNFLSSGTEKYRCKKYTTQAGGGIHAAGLVTATLDLHKCTFAISIKNTSLAVTTGDIPFAMQFGSFDIDPVTVSLP